MPSYILSKIEPRFGVSLRVGDIIEWPFRSGVPRIVTEIDREHDHLVLEVPT